MGALFAGMLAVGTAVTAAAEPGVAGPVPGPTVEMEPAELDNDGWPAERRAVGELEPATVLVVDAEGFGRFAGAEVRQCVVAGEERCTDPLPVRFDRDGKAEFQFLVTDTAGGILDEPACGAYDAPCTVVVEAVHSSTRAEIRTVFVDPVPDPGTIRVHPDSDLARGQSVIVEVEGYPPGRSVQVLICAPPASLGTQRCEALDPAAPLQVGSDGTGRTQVPMTSGLVGTERVRCDYRSACAVSVADDETYAAAPPVRVSLARPPGAEYDPVRMAGGLGVAAVLMVIATLLIRRTDWSPPGEAAAPEIDEAVYADLDAIIDALPPDQEP